DARRPLEWRDTVARVKKPFDLEEFRSVVDRLLRTKSRNGVAGSPARVRGERSAKPRSVKGARAVKSARAIKGARSLSGSKRGAAAPGGGALGKGRER